MDKYDSGMIYVEEVALALEGDYSPFLVELPAAAPQLSAREQRERDFDPANFIVD